MNNGDPAPYPLPLGLAVQEGDFVRVASDNFDSLVMQDTRVYKAGNSLVIRIPSAIAKHCGLKDGAPVQVAADHGMIYVRKAPPRELGALLERITPENLHGAHFDEPVGAEGW